MTQVNNVPAAEGPKHGQRFLFAQSVEEGGSPPITVVLNWAAEHRD